MKMNFKPAWFLYLIYDLLCFLFYFFKYFICMFILLLCRTKTSSFLLEKNIAFNIWSVNKEGNTPTLIFQVWVIDIKHLLIIVMFSLDFFYIVIASWFIKFKQIIPLLKQFYSIASFEIYGLTLNTPITTKVVCFSRLLKCLRSPYDK